MANLHVEPLPSEHKVTVAKREPPTRDALSGDQVVAFDALLNWVEDDIGGYISLGGLAGTGKTTIVAALVKHLQRSRSVALTAFTGKAVDVLKRKLATYGIAAPCMTLHSMLYRPKLDKHGNVTGWSKKWKLGEYSERDDGTPQVDPFELIIVDEASMLNAELWEDLTSYGVPIIAVGDHGQLPPVGSDALNIMLKPHLRLEKIHRQAADNPIIALAHAVRAGGHLALYKHKNNPDDRRVWRASRFSEVRDTVALGGLNAVGICAFNNTRARLNLEMHARVVEVHGDDANDIVICLRNYDHTIFNGMRGILRSVDGEPDKLNRCWVTVDFPENDLRCKAQIQLLQFGRPTGITVHDIEGAMRWGDVGLLFDYGFVVTCHKAQGSQWDDVVVQWETTKKQTDDERKRWLYTAVTRASERLVVVT